jgi:anti-sigma-K factor RskA
MTDTADRDDDEALAGEYALGLMEFDARRAFETRLASESVLRAQVRCHGQHRASDPPLHHGAFPRMAASLSLFPKRSPPRWRAERRIEIMFGRLKDWRRVATRYDRCPKVFLSAIALAAAVIFWL